MTLKTPMVAKALQIFFQAIPDTGLEVALDLGPEWVARWRQEDPDLEFADAHLTGTVRLEKHDRDVLVRGRLAGYLNLTCGRCLDPFAEPVETEFDLLLAPGPPAATAAEVELSRADLDVDYYTGEVVALEDLLREQIILLIPLKPLCNEVCQGLCLHCGANLNRQTCNCRTAAVHSPFASLAKLKN